MSEIDGRRNRDRDAESGQYREHATDDDLLAAVRDHAPASSREVAETVGLKRDSAYKRLTRLRDDTGRVESKKAGRSLIWFPADAPEADV